MDSDSAGRYDLIIEQGAFFEKVFTWKDPNNNPINNTGFAFTLTAEIPGYDTPVISLGVGTGITLGGASGKVTVEISDEVTATYDFDVIPYNIEYNPPSGKKKRWIAGFITLSRDV